jgi:hypothetical protein
MKHLTGRLGPLLTDQVHTVWAGGTIYPSGHAANAVVMYGLIALLAPAAHRRLMTKVAVFLAISIGLGTVLLNTHWVSDVFGGWIAGVLVLQLTWLLAPRVTAVVERTAARVRPVIGRWWAVLEFHQSPAARAVSDRRWGDAGGAAGPATSAVTAPVAIAAVPALRSDAVSRTHDSEHGRRLQTAAAPRYDRPDPRARADSGRDERQTPAAKVPSAPRAQKTLTIPTLRAARGRRSAPPVDAVH